MLSELCCCSYVKEIIAVDMHVFISPVWSECLFHCSRHAFLVGSVSLLCYVMLPITVVHRSRLLNTDSVKLSSFNLGNNKEVRSFFIVLTFHALIFRARQSDGVKRCSSQVRPLYCTVEEDPKLLTENKLAGSKIFPSLDNSSLEKIEEIREKQPQAQFLPVCSWKCTSPFCFSVAAGPHWLIASLIQFSRAFFKGLQVSLGFCTSGFLLLASRFQLCKVIQRICCDCSRRKDAPHFKLQNSITNIAVTR